MNKNTKSALDSIISIVYITPENAVIGEKNSFLTLSFTTKDENGETKTTDYDRVFLHRAFPFDHPESYISVQDADKNEIGMISDLSIFPPETAALLRGELTRKYYALTLTAIHSIRDRYGYAYCFASAEDGPINFTMRDVARSILKVDENHIVMTDIDGNRYDIPDIHKLDRKSYRRIELYL